MIAFVNGDSKRIPLSDNSVQCVITSPPYWNLRDYGTPGQLGLERTPQEYVASIVSVMREVKRVLKPDGTLWLNLGDTYSANRGYQVTQTKDAGTKRSDDGFNNMSMKSNNIGVAPKNLVGIPWRVAFALQEDGWYLRSDIIWSKPNPMPESVVDRPTKSHEYVFLLSKKPKYYYDSDAIKEPAVMKPQNRNTDGRGGKDDGYQDHRKAPGMTNPETRNKRTVWTITPKPYSGAHFATFPTALVDPMILAGSKEGDIVLDPFSGSGTVGVVCLRHGRNFVGLDLSLSYITDCAKERIRREGFPTKKVEDTSDADIEGLVQGSIFDMPE